MDNFMDKLAHKFNAQEMIKANSQAEAEEMKRLQLQIAEYENILQEMRKLNYRNTELSEKLDLMISDNADKIQGMKEEEQRLIAALRDLTDEQTRKREAEQERIEEERLEREQVLQKNSKADMTAITNLLEDKFQRSDDFVHKENVKVYRNVQAVVIDELKRYTESAQEDKNRLDKRLNLVMTFSIVSMIVSTASMILWALFVFGMIR